MASGRWLSIKVELLSGGDIVLEHPAGRVMIASARHTLAELAEAIDLAFARWDHSHLHSFVYVFDLGDDWRHRCEIQSVDVDPAEAYGTLPDTPVPIWGWGWFPDQYGRIGEGE